MTATAQQCLIPPVRVRIDWTVPNGSQIIDFQIYRAGSAAENPGLVVATVPGSSRSFMDGESQGAPPLAEQTAYWYRVRARGVVPGLRSDSASAFTADCP